MEVKYSKDFIKQYNKIKNQALKNRLKKLIFKIKNNPLLGKPMKNERKGTRELYLGSYRLSYIFYENKLLILILELYHKDKQ
jgi:addiction module RelE/StbE family toxin